MNLLNYLKSKYRKFISTGLDNENKNQNLNLEQSNKIANSITLLIMGLSGLTLFWLTFAKTDQIIIVNGELQPTSRIRSIKLPISGVVEEVYVKEGNLVEKDEKLLKIDDALNIEIKKNLINKISLKEEELKLKESELENSILILKNEINEINSILLIEKDNLEKFSSVYEEGAISKIDYDAQKIKVLNYFNDLNNKEILTEVKKSELSQEIKFIQDNLLNYKNQLEEIQENLKYSLIKSPIAGYVYEIKAKDKGFVIDSNQDILKIVPEENLEAVIFINSKDIGFVMAGQDVELSIDSYPSSDFGGVDGIISFISANSRKIDNRDSNLFYEAKVKLNNQLLELNSGKNLSLKPGMSLTANIKLRRLSYLQLLFSIFSDKSKSIQQL